MAARDKVVARVGGARVEIDNTELRLLADRITQGAVSTFLRAAHRQADPIVEAARTERELWPIRTGRSIAGTHIRETVTADRVAVTVYSDQPYTYRIRYSVRTAEEMQRSAREMAAAVWAEAGPMLTARDPEDRAAQGRWAISRFFEADRRWQPIAWPAKLGVPTEEGLAAYQLRLWRRSHGRGAPNERLAGRNVWSVRIRQPMKRAEPALIDEARAALERLAGG